WRCPVIMIVCSCLIVSARRWFFSLALHDALPILQAAEAERCGLITLADVGWTDITMTTAVARLVLADLGYRTQVKRLSLPETYQGLADGSIDVFLGSWMPAQTQLIESHLKSGRIDKLQT